MLLDQQIAPLVGYTFNSVNTNLLISTHECKKFCFLAKLCEYVLVSFSLYAHHTLVCSLISLREYSGNFIKILFRELFKNKTYKHLLSVILLEGKVNYWLTLKARYGFLRSHINISWLKVYLKFSKTLQLINNTSSYHSKMLVVR